MRVSVQSPANPSMEEVENLYFKNLVADLYSNSFSVYVDLTGKSVTLSKYLFITGVHVVAFIFKNPFVDRSGRSSR